MSELRAVAELIAPGAASSCVLLDCRHSLDAPDYGRQAYQAGHIPGAQFASIDEVLSGPLIPGQSGRHPLPCPETLSAQLRAWGINHDSEVVVYDDAQSAYAARAWWLLRWLGHERVKVLDGGLAAWCREGGLLAVTETPRAAGNFVAHLQQDKTISADALLAQLHSPALALLDARALPVFAARWNPSIRSPVISRAPSVYRLPIIYKPMAGLSRPPNCGNALRRLSTAAQNLSVAVAPGSPPVITFWPWCTPACPSPSSTPARGANG